MKVRISDIEMIKLDLKYYNYALYLSRVSYNLNINFIILLYIIHVERNFIDRLKQKNELYHIEKV